MTGQAPIPWSIFANLPEPVLVLDADRTIISANKAALDLLGKSIEGADLALALRQPAALAVAGTAMEGEQPNPAELTIAIGAPRTFEVRAAPIPGGGDARAVVTLHDMTGERRAEGMRADFVANVSHELRSPLASLLGFIETLQGPAKDDVEAQEKFLGIMQSEAERMARLIDDLLSLSRVEADEHIQPRNAISITPLLKRAIDVVRPGAEERNMTLRLNAADGLPDVAGDDDQLMQVFQNLLVNAVKYGRPKTDIFIDAKRVERVPGTTRTGVAISITDQGEGIPARDLSRLTERFYRVDKARSRALGGTGLGLAIVKHIVGRHRGKLAISSEVGVGSTFSVTLPVIDP